jgi:hypothetical protein
LQQYNINNSNKKVKVPNNFSNNVNSERMGAEMIAKPKSIKRIIVQKYIENPLLYNRRKFDIRIWVLVNQEKKVYFYMDGYARTSSLEFNL